MPANPFTQPARRTRDASGQFVRRFPTRREIDRRQTLAAKWAADHAAMRRFGVATPMPVYEINAYVPLGLPTRTNKGKWISHELYVIRRAYLRALFPASPVTGEFGSVEIMSDALAAGEVLLHDREAHDRAVEKGGLYTLAACPMLPIEPDADPVPYAVDLALRWGEIDAILEYLPDVVFAHRLGESEVLGLSEALRDALEELEALEGAALDADASEHREADHAERLRRWVTSGTRVAFAFRAKRWESLGKRVHGKASKLSPQVRAIFPGDDHAKPTHLVTLNLAAWATMSRTERTRLVLHELLHFDPARDEDGAWRVKFRAHQIEDFAVCLRRFGPADADQVRAIVEGATSPALPAAVKAWEVRLDARGQSLLFELARC